MANLKDLTFTGSDVCNEISLCEYGMLLAKRDDYYYIIFGCGTDDCGNYISFNWCINTEDDLNDIIKDNIDEDVLSYVGSTLEEWNQFSLFQRLFDLYGYYGTQVFNHYDNHNLLTVDDLHKKFNLGF